MRCALGSFDYIHSRLLTRPPPCFAPIASAKVWAGMEVGGDEGLYPREISMTWGDDCDVEVGTHMKSPMIQTEPSLFWVKLVRRDDTER